MPRITVIVLVLFLIAIPALHMLPIREIDLGVKGPGTFSFTHVIHAGMFIPWGALGLCFAYRSPRGRLARGAAWILLGLLLACGAEGVQHWISYRAFSTTDLAFNLGGLLAGSLVLVVLRPKPQLWGRCSSGSSGNPPDRARSPGAHPARTQNLTRDFPREGHRVAGERRRC